MMPLIAAEALKMRKRWMPRILLIVSLIILVLIFWGVATNATQRTDVILPRAWVSGLYFTTFIAPFIWPILGGSWAGSEYGWGTIRMVLSRRPGREQFVLSGLVILAVFILVGLLAALVISSIAGTVVALLTGKDVFISHYLDGSFLLGLLKVALAAWYVLLFYVAVAYAAGTLFQSGAVGIGVGIGLTLADFILTGIFAGLGGTWKTLAEHFPVVYSQALPARVIQGAVSGNMVTVTRDVPGVPESIIGLGLYIAVPVLLALALIRFRDVTS